MKDLNIPIYRAKKIDNVEYVIGFYYYDKNLDAHHIEYVENPREGFRFGRTMHPRIDESTLAIHFPDMLDSDGNPIFSSLQEDGKGGDICHCTSKYQSITNEKVARYGSGSHKNFLPWAIEINFENKSYKYFYDEIRVIGIQE